VRKLAFGAVEKKIARKVQNYLDTTTREDALASMRNVFGSRILEHADKTGERRGGDALQVKHTDLEPL
jgi:hypothetical protein